MIVCTGYRTMPSEGPVPVRVRSYSGAVPGTTFDLYISMSVVCMWCAVHLRFTMYKLYYFLLMSLFLHS